LDLFRQIFFIKAWAWILKDSEHYVFFYIERLFC